MTKRSSILSASKEVEREVARQLGGRRLHAGEWSGMGGRGDVDVLGDDFIAQVKHRRNVPIYITEGFKQIREAAEKTLMTPLVIIRTKPGRGREAETFVMMDVATFNSLASFSRG